jgi:hypothetical protein
MQIAGRSLPLLNPEPRTLNPIHAEIIQMILPWHCSAAVAPHVVPARGCRVHFAAVKLLMTTIPRLLCCLVAGMLLGGCATIRVTDPPRTADEEFLLSQAAEKAVSQLALDALRDRLVWIETSYLFSTSQPFDRSFLVGEVRQPSFEEIYLIAELRARMLRSGVRLASTREKAQVILEVRSGGISINREEYLLGVPATAVPGSIGGTITIATPELAILKKTTQRGFASIAFVAYWADTGELLTLSGPFVGQTHRLDSWILGYGPVTNGDIPPAKP